MFCLGLGSAVGEKRRKIKIPVLFCSFPPFPFSPVRTLRYQQTIEFLKQSNKLFMIST